MAAKLEIATKIQHSFEDVAATLPVTLRLLNHNYLIGGYSGSNDRVELDDGLVAVLKITNGYSAEHAEFAGRRSFGTGRLHRLLSRHSEKGCRQQLSICITKEGMAFRPFSSRFQKANNPIELRATTNTSPSRS